MKPELRALAATQRGLVTRRQCHEAGYRDSELRQLTRPRGAWVVVRAGVYVERVLWEASSGPDRLVLGDVAAHLVVRVPHVMSHDSAARGLSVPLLADDATQPHLTRDGLRGTRTEAGIKHHSGLAALTDVRSARPLRLTSPARTALDVAREHGLDAGVVAVDHVRSRGVTMEALTGQLDRMSSWPHVQRVRDALTLSDPRAESVAESLGRLLLVEMGFTDIDVGWPVAVGGHVFWVDLRVGCHLVEVDGLAKYVDRAAGGLADRPTRSVLRDERRRQAAICSVGLGMSRVMPDDLRGRARERAKEQIAAEHAVTVARFGETLPAHLAEQAARIRRTTPRRRAG